MARSSNRKSCHSDHSLAQISVQNEIAPPIRRAAHLHARSRGCGKRTQAKTGNRRRLCLVCVDPSGALARKRSGCGRDDAIDCFCFGVRLLVGAGRACGRQVQAVCPLRRGARYGEDVRVPCREFAHLALLPRRRILPHVRRHLPQIAARRDERSCPDLSYFLRVMVGAFAASQHASGCGRG
jgi:hypothetical protein